MTHDSARRCAARKWPSPPRAGRIALLVALVLAPLGCREPASRPQGPSDALQTASLAPLRPHHGPGELWLTYSDEPQSIDPALCNDSVGTEVITNLFAGLVELEGEALTPVPDLAQTWSISPDGRTYTFTLRKAVWSDGEPLTAHDFVYSIERVLDPETACRYASMLDLIEGAQARRTGSGAKTPVGVVALDDHRLQFKLTHPAPYFLQFVSYNLFRPVPRHLFKRLRAQNIPQALWTRPEHVVSSGAFTLASWRFKRDYVLAKNPAYWDADNVRLRRVWVQMVPSAGTAINLYRAGAIDWTGPGLPSAYVAHLRALPDFFEEPMLSSYFYWLNTQKPPLDDVRVREALGLAIDRRALTAQVLRGGQEPSTSLVPPGVGPYPPVPPQGDGGLDVPRARQLLKEAGYTAQKPLPPLTLIYNTHESHKQVAEALQAMWQQNLGVQVQLHNQEWRVFLQHITEGDFHMARMGWVGDYPDALSFLQDVLGQSSGNNMSGWTDPAYEALLTKAAHSADVAGRQALLHDAEALALRAAPLLPLFVSRQASLRHPTLKGLRPNSMGHHPYKHLYFEGPDAQGAH